MDYLLERESKFPGNNFEPGAELRELFEENAQILVVGAGGLGCEILKNLALSGVRNIYLIDLDTIELSNLNRQFLFREKDIGRFKAEVATEFIKNKFPQIDIKFSNRKIQEFTDDFFRQFQVIIGGLDNMEARSWLNEKVHDLVAFDANGTPKPETIIPYIDGGTEGFRGQSRVIIPYTTACSACTAQLSTDRKVYPLCTIAETPRIPEHCIEYIYLVQWQKSHPNKVVDKDSVDDVTWIYEEAMKRANSFNIQGVTYSLTLGVLKNVIPAIASTNAIIAASTCIEAIKLISGCSKVLDNYFMYMGHEGLYSSTTVYEKKDDCKVCSVRVLVREVKPEMTWGQVFEGLKGEFQLEDPDILSKADYLMMKGAGKTDLIPKLSMTMQQLFDSKEISSNKLVIITDDSRNGIPIKIKFQLAK